MSPALRLKLAGQRLRRHSFLQGKSVGSSHNTGEDIATTPALSEVDERSDLGVLASPLVSQERETPFSHFRSGAGETRSEMSKNKSTSLSSEPILFFKVLRGSQLAKEKVLSEHRDTHDFFEKNKLIKQFAENMRLRQDCLVHSLNWTHKN